MSSPIELFLLLLGLLHVTFSKKHPSWSYRSETSLPLKIFAMNVPPGLRTCNVIDRAARRSCACMNSSRSCRPVTVKKGLVSLYALGQDIERRSSYEKAYHPARHHILPLYRAKLTGHQLLHRMSACNLNICDPFTKITRTVC